MDRSELHFDLPAALIAQEPVLPRDHCRLLALERAAKIMKDDVFYHMGEYLRPNDVLVFNQSKVIPARLLGKKESGGAVEVLLLRYLGQATWTCLLGGKVKEGQRLQFPQNVTAEILPREGDAARVRFSLDGEAFQRFLDQAGTMPTPPYIKKLLADPSLYQTVYAREQGSAAAPTAGLHFTQGLLDELKAKGISQEFVTLHVGLGTFQPVKTERVEDHPIHTEWFSLSAETFSRLQQAKAEGRRIVAVGTTSVRVLETVFGAQGGTGFGVNKDGVIAGETNIFIYPGYKFQAVDALITNFHTPYSSLLALVYAFAGQEFTRNAYQHAIAEKYRFFSFGDAMLIE